MLRGYYHLAALGVLAEALKPTSKSAFYLAGGKTEDMLREAYTGYKADRDALKHVQDKLGASRVEFSGKVERTIGWPEMNAAHGFKVYFEKDKQPEGWYSPKQWGNRQSYFETRVYLPAEGSPEQIFLQDMMAIRNAALKETPNLNVDPQEDRTYNWSFWNQKALAALKIKNKPLVWLKDDPNIIPLMNMPSYTVEVAGNGAAFVLDAMMPLDADPKSFIPAGSVMISKASAKNLLENPGNATSLKAQLFDQRTIGRRIADALTFR